MSANRRSSIAKKDLDMLMSMGIDIGKDTFHIVAFDPDGQLVAHKQIRAFLIEQDITVRRGL